MFFFPFQVLRLSTRMNPVLYCHAYIDDLCIAENFTVFLAWLLQPALYWEFLICFLKSQSTYHAYQHSYSLQRKMGVLSWKFWWFMIRQNKTSRDEWTWRKQLCLLVSRAINKKYFESMPSWLIHGAPLLESLSWTALSPLSVPCTIFLTIRTRSLQQSSKDKAERASKGKKKSVAWNIYGRRWVQCFEKK